jgi:DNA helicase HerA-like ATPase
MVRFRLEHEHKHELATAGLLQWDVRLWMLDARCLLPNWRRSTIEVMAEPILVAQSKEQIFLLPKMANRHGLIAGATGTGKTVTLQTLAENFSARGVPVFMADVKGDLAGLSQPGGNNPKVLERAKELKIDNFTGEASPVVFWDVFGEQGHPVRATISEMGPLLLGRLLDLNDTQEGVLNIVFKIADENGLLLLDLKDLRSMLQYVADNADQFKTQYGNISAASAGAIQRNLLALESQGANKFFGEPALNLDDLIQTQGGKGVINILAADKLMQKSPKVYATLLLWMLSELFENLPEIGDPEKPKLVFFFDEAHLLFTDIAPTVQQKIEQVVRLIRSKGVGVYFVSQNPLDIPDVVLGQLGNRVQHALRAFTPRDQKAVKAAAETFRQNPKLQVEAVLTQLGVGEALVSMLDENGSPEIVERAKIVPPRSQVGAITPDQRKQIINSSVLAGHYEKAIDRESAYEILQARAGEKVQTAEAPAVAAGAPAGEQTQPSMLAEALGTVTAAFQPTIGPRGAVRDSLATSVAKSAMRAASSQLGRQLVRGILGGILGGSGSRRR